jgi:hypothetical protein
LRVASIPAIISPEALNSHLQGYTLLIFDEQKAGIPCGGEDGQYDVAHTPKQKEPGRPQGENNSIALLTQLLFRNTVRKRHQASKA